MKIQRLDIQGFKSFADRTSIRFGDGITGVVGPNGCGKSNIVDAIRWAMGEQSARMLRGGSMQDVIFNGSSARGPTGMAEVTLAFENDGRGLPPEYAHVGEIQVTRRLYRDGESEYEINKTPCRLKDVHDLFLGTGIGTRAYSIISQGQVNELMAVKPEERRRIIEEAAGITKYKARKEQATRKMESTRQNLQRIDDVTKELGKRLGSLKRQAKKAEKYKELKGQAREIELHLTTLRFFELHNAIGFDSARYAELTAGLKDDVERVAELEKGIDEGRRTLSEDERLFNDKQKRIYDVQSAIALSTQIADHAKKDYDASKQRDAEAAAEIERIREQRAVVEGIRSELLSTQRSLFEERKDDDTTLEQAQQALDDAKKARVEAGQIVDTLRKNVIEQSSRSAKIGAELNNVKSSLADMEKRKEATTQERAPLTDELVRLDELLVQHASEKDSVEADKTAAETERKAASDAIVAGKQQLQQTQRKADEARVELQRRRSRLASLEEIHQRFEQSPEAVRALLKRGGPLEGKARLLVDLFEADTAWEGVIEQGLGARLQSVLVDTAETARTALTFLGGQKVKGRAEFLVDDAVGDAGPTIDGALRALDVVKLNKKATRGAEVTLSRLYLVDDSAAAVAVWPKVRAVHGVVVTKDGEVYGADGALRGGVADKEGQGVLRQKREMRELADDVATRDEAQRGLDEGLQNEQQALASLDEELQRATERAQQLSIKLVEVRAAHKRVSDENARVKQRVERLAADEERLTTSLVQAVASVEEKTAQLIEAETLRGAAETELQQRSHGLIDLDAAIADKQDTFTTMKVRAASFAERTETLKRSLSQQEQQAKDLAERFTRLEKQIADGHTEREQLTKQEADARGKLATLSEERTTLKASLEEARGAFEKASETLRIKEIEMRAARTALDTARESHSGLQLRIREREMELDALTDRTIERHKVTPGEIVYDFHMQPLPSDEGLAEMEARLHDLERQAEGLGAINLAAIEEARSIEKRHDFLRTQADDLTHALNQLEKAIIKINRTTKKRFQETFEGINERFQQVFPRLFRGGKAWLSLTDPNDMLTTGVEIYAQPPGKKLAGLALLSGGEKALTAVSLLFAIFLLKPSPFCLLDEVDAPLDETNVGRFNDMVKDVSAISQFIVITHKKETMEVADQLYGITMEEPGISKTVNVRIQ